MSNDDTQHDDDLDDPNEGNIAHLREQAGLAKAAQADAAAARRELLFARAGVDTESKLGKLLYKTWEGDDLTALQAEAAELGITGTPAKTGPTAAELEQQAIRQGLTGQAAGAVDAPSVDPTQAAIIGFHKAIELGQQEEDARMDAFGAIFKAGQQGDRRVMFNEAEYRQKAADLA